MFSRLADLPLEIIQVFSCFEGAAGALVVEGLTGSGAIREATLAQVCCGWCKWVSEPWGARCGGRGCWG